MFNYICTSQYLIWFYLFAFTAFLRKYFLKYCWKSFEEESIFGKLQAYENIFGGDFSKNSLKIF